VRRGWGGERLLTSSATGEGKGATRLRTSAATVGRVVRLLTSAATAGVALEARAAEGWVESFDRDPMQSGWEVVGDASLFAWNEGAKSLAVTWDSSRTNSYFLKRLASPVTAADDFAFGFGLKLSEHAVGTTPGKSGTFQIALGLIRVADASDPGFQRGVFLRSRNLVEWTWFGAQPDGAISASLSPAVVPADGRLPWGFSDSYLELETGVQYGFDLTYTATNRTLRISMTADGTPLPTPAPVVLPRSFTGFRVDALSINSYSDVGQDPLYAGSVRAVGTVDDLRWNGPGAAVGAVRFEGNEVVRRVVTGTRVGWRYWLESSGDLKAWEKVSEEVAGTGSEVVLQDATKGLPPERFYRVGARLP